MNIIKVPNDDKTVVKTIPETAFTGSDETARILLDATDEAVLLADINGSIISTNARFAGNYGSNVRDLAGKNIFDLLSADTAKRMKNMINEVVREGSTIRYEEEENGAWYEKSLYPIRNESDNISKVALFTKDITNERRYEEALRESESKYKQIVDTANEGILVIDEKSRITLVNRQAQAMLGYSEEEIIGKSFRDFLHKDELDDHDQRMKQRSLGVAERYERRLEKKDGSLLWVIFSASPIFDAKNRYKGSITLFADITEQKNVEKVIRESEEQYRTAIEHSNDGVVMVRGDSFIYVNQKFVDMFGYDTPDEIIGKQQSMTIHPDEVANVTTTNIKRQLGEDVPERYEFRGKRKDDSSIYVEVSATKTHYRGETVTLAYLRDITSRRHMEDELLKSKKLESIGILAGGIAHDFNNLLMSILGYISLARMYAQSGGDSKKTLDKLADAEKMIDRAKELTRQLLTFSKGGSPLKKTIRLEPAVRETVKIPLSGSGIKCKYHFQEHLWPIKADKSQIKQVIHHLTLNAREAMEEGGSITFSAGNVSVEKDHESLLPPGDYVELSVSDTGKGIEEGNLSRIFDPYFTTKDFGPQKGMGLGLAVCYSIIKKHGGLIEVRSVVNEGTTFKIYLQAEKQPVTTNHHGQPGTLPKRFKVLIADDEESVRTTTALLLGHLGHDVSSISDGKEAIELYRLSKESGQPFDAVILDLVSPGGLGGVEILKELLKIDPGVYALLSSGYSNDPQIVNYRQYGFKGVLLKPYRIEDLEEVLKRVIGTR